MVAPGSIPGPDPEGQLPQSLLCQVVVEVVEEGNDVIIRLQRVATAEEIRVRNYDQTAT